MPASVFKLRNTEPGVMSSSGQFAASKMTGRPERTCPLLVGRSPQMRELIELIDRVAQSDAPVIVTGETGTGKEVVAEAIHAASPRAGKPFVVCDLSALGSALLESELFGHRKGSFTSADRERQGAFVNAHGGTLFLDEVGELPRASQPRLLRAIERREIKPLGGDEFRVVDVRIIAATNRDLAAECRMGHFRSDLYHRLAVVRLSLPPLRERREDIPLLAARLMEEMAVRRGRPLPLLSGEAMRTLVLHDWPGNVRELKNVLQRAVSLASDARSLEANHLGITLRRSSVPTAFRQAKDQVIDRWEREYVEDAVRDAGGNLSLAARTAGITRAHLYRLMKKHRIVKPA